MLSLLNNETTQLGHEDPSTGQSHTFRHSCGSTDVRMSHKKRGFLINLAKRLGYDAYRCRACGKRFFKRQA